MSTLQTAVVVIVKLTGFLGKSNIIVTMLARTLSRGC